MVVGKLLSLFRDMLARVAESLRWMGVVPGLDHHRVTVGGQLMHGLTIEIVLELGTGMTRRSPPFNKYWAKAVTVHHYRYLTQRAFPSRPL